MARKYDLISELYDSTCKTVTANSKNWEAFLRSACRNFKLRFDEQLLVYAQRPDATAVLEIERWNKNFGRWVNRGAHGIAVFEDANKNRQRLIHYFDISDTHESNRSRPAPIWKMKPEYTESIITTLENSFGTLNSKRNLSEAIIFASMNASEDNLHDYIQDFAEMRAESNLAQFSVEKANGIYSALVTGSIAYMIMSRLEVDTSKVLPSDFFADIAHFNTPQTLNALGFAVSDIAEMGLTEIARTVLALEKENRIIAGNGKADYNIGRENNERSFGNERDQIYNAGRLSASQPDNAGAAGSELGQIRSDEKEVSEGTSQSPLLQSSDELHPDRTLGGNGAESLDDGRNADEADGGEGRNHGEPESGGYDVLGSENEQFEEPGAGDRESGSNLRLVYDRQHEDKSLPFFGGDEVINEILGTTPHLKASKDEIRAFYENTLDDTARTEYIKSIFNDDYTELILSDGRRVGYKTFENVLHLWEGSYLSRTAQSYYDWGVIAKHFEAMRLLGELQDTIKPLPSINGQPTLMFEAEDKKSSAFTFSQEIIDAVLTRGSGVSEGKMRIYEQFEKSLSAKENADFLKNEYGWGGSYPVIVGAGIDEQHDGKGITISKGIGSDKPNVKLTWTQVEKRIGELIRLDRYLNPKEKAFYSEWLQKQEERRAELAEEGKNREILNTAPPEKESVTAPETAEYEYHLGDTVYMGADEYEILSFDDERVMLHDMQYPLFQKEMDRAEFDCKVRENPMNDHLKVTEPMSKQKTDEEPEIRFSAIEFEKLIPYHMRFKETDVVNGSEVYWVTQGIFNAGDLRDFQKAVKEYDGNIKKFYVTSRSISSYDFEEDAASKALAIITSDTILKDDYIHAIEKAGLSEYLHPEISEETVAEKRIDNNDLVYINDEQLALLNTEEDSFSDIDAAAIREALAKRGIVNGEVVDADKLNADPFIHQVVTDVEQVEDKSEQISPALPLKKRTRVQTFDLHPNIPMSERHTFDLASHEVEEVGKKERFRRNILAIQLLKKCQNENRFATPDEQEVLSKYVGWGGIPEAFDKNNSSWSDEFKELYTVLSPAEYESANGSILTAFYTPPAVISAIYKAMEQMGFREGNILEPSCGIGNFIGMLPKSMKEAKMYGVEIDKISAGIAQQLYQKTSIAAQPFEEANVPDSFFDAIVGNVPFGDIRVNDRRYNKYNFLIHDYFFAKSLDKLRPGGIMALVTSKGTMDKENSAVRKYIAQRADLLGAIRLPNNTFKGNAGTEVVSDILILQKRDRINDIEPDWVYLNTDENGFKMNSYFVDHPEMVLGEWKTVSGRFGDENTVVPYENADLAAQLDEAISNIHAEITAYESEEELEEEDTSIPADPNVRNFSYTVVDDKIYYRENSRMTPVDCSATAENRIKGMIGIRDCVRNLLEIQTLD